MIMTLCDSNPLVALINRKDGDHALCIATLPLLSTPLVTTWPCIAEAMYLLYKYGGHSPQEELWKWIADGILQIHINTETELERMRALMRQYFDTPMDLADASLVAAAEILGQKRIFTLDSDFFVYRLQDGSSLEVVPSW